MPLSVIHGSHPSSDRIYLGVVVDELEEQDVDHALILQWRDGDWKRWQANAQIVGITSVSSPEGTAVFAASSDGHVQVAGPDGIHWERIVTTGELPSSLRRITGIRIIGEHVYAFGMARQVFRREVERGGWRRFDEGALVPREEFELSGFLSIDGWEGLFYGVGFFGELWGRTGERWYRLPSPTNVKLTAVRFRDASLAFAVGSSGTVLRGTDEGWGVMWEERSVGDFTGLEILGDDLYVISEGGDLLRVSGEGVDKVAWGGEVALDLDVQGDRLLVVGGAHVGIFDGSEWRTIPLPFGGE